MRNQLVVAAAALVLAAPASAHHAATNARVEAHHTAADSHVQAHHTAADSHVQAHHTAVDAQLQAHHTAAGTALTGSAAAAEAAGNEIARGPHEGALVPLGDGAAVLEFTYDPATGMFEMYVWDGALESPVQISQNMVFLKVPAAAEAEDDRAVMLVPVENAAAGEGKGHASKFNGGLKWLIGQEEFDVVLEGVKVGDQFFRLATFSMPDGNGHGAGHPAWVPAEDTAGSH